MQHVNIWGETMGGTTCSHVPATVPGVAWYSAWEYEDGWATRLKDPGPREFGWYDMLILGLKSIAIWLVRPQIWQASVIKKKKKKLGKIIPQKLIITIKLLK